MARFNLYEEKLKRWEGGFVNNPLDPGGATNMGVTLNTYRKYYGYDKTVEDLKHIPEDEWRAIMMCYWNRCKGDFIRNQSIAEMLVDWHINAGMPAIKGIQRLVGVNADGIIGNLTLGGINGGDQEYLFDRLKRARIQYYKNLVDAKPQLGTFLKGWINRTNSFVFEP